MGFGSRCLFPGLYSLPTRVFNCYAAQWLFYYLSWGWQIAMFLVTSPIVINVPTRGLLAVETMHAIVQWLENLNIKEI